MPNQASLKNMIFKTVLPIKAFFLKCFNLAFSKYVWINLLLQAPYSQCSLTELYYCVQRPEILTFSFQIQNSLCSCQWRQLVCPFFWIIYQCCHTHVFDWFTCISVISIKSIWSNLLRKFSLLTSLAAF